MSGHGAVAVSVWGRGQKNFEIVDADKPSFFARITDAELSEISLVDCPANPPALVCSRTPVPPLQFFDAALRYVDAIKTLITLLPALSAATKSEGAACARIRGGGQRSATT